ncbi:MAG: DNA polymerase I [Planctomycetaceae bacterium]|nr:DNA polymerase I [Planctomycetaceae bacterium]
MSQQKHDANDAIWILDAHGILYQVFHALPSDLSSPQGEPVGAIFGFVRDLLTLYFDHKPASLFCTFDMPGKTFRHEIDVQYKANRKEMPEPLSVQIKLLHPVLEAFGIPAFGVPAFEADDLMATIATQAEATGRDCVLVTADKDCRQLVTDRVSLFNLRKQAFYRAENLLDDWGIRPDQVVDFQAMVGDSSDNVPGIPLIGPKLATQLLQQYETLENILDHADEVSGQKRKENLKNGRAAAMMCRELVRLRRDVPLEIDWEAGRVQGFDGERLRAMFHRFGFRRDLPKIDTLVQVFGEIASANGSATTAKTTTSLFDFADSKEQRNVMPSIALQGDAANFPFPNPKYHLVNDASTFETFLTALRGMIAERGRDACFSFDLETTALEFVHAQIVGMSFCWHSIVGPEYRQIVGPEHRQDEAWYIAMRAPLGEPVLKQKTVFAELQPILENAAVGKIGQNIKYDMLILRKFGVRLTGVQFDTMVADYLLHAGEQRHNLDDLAERYLGRQTIKIHDLIGSGKRISGRSTGKRRMDEVLSRDVCDYAAEDALIPWLLRPILEPMLERQQLTTLFQTLELPLIDVLVELEANGITIDVEQLRTLSRHYAERLSKLEDEIHKMAGETFNIASPKQLQTILFDKLKLPTGKKTKTGASTDIEVLEQLAPIHPIAAKLIEFRQASKLKGTYIDALPQLADPQTRRIHASFNQVVTATGRLSSSDPNLQNIPIRTEEGRAIRTTFVPGEPFDAILSCDYSQIELRVLAHFTGDENLCDAFASGEDIHTSVAAQVFHVALDEVTSEMRRTAKAVNFGIIYGQSAFGLAKQLDIEQREAAVFIDAYFAKYPTIGKFLDETLDACLRDGFVTSYAGRRRRITGIRPNRVGQLNLSERTAINTVIQGSAADLMKMAMIAVHRRMTTENYVARMLLQIHDELVFEVTRSQIAPFEEMLRSEMSLGQPLSVPLVVDISVGDHWGAAK